MRAATFTALCQSSTSYCYFFRTKVSALINNKQDFVKRLKKVAPKGYNQLSDLIVQKEVPREESEEYDEKSTD